MTAHAVPALSACGTAGVTDRLGVHRNTAQAALTALRAERMADVMEQRGLTAAQAAAARRTDLSGPPVLSYGHNNEPTEGASVRLSGFVWLIRLLPHCQCLVVPSM